MDTEPESRALQCESCGLIVSRLHSVPHKVRSLSLGRDILQDELICDRCLLELQEEYTDEELTRGPA